MTITPRVGVSGIEFIRSREGSEEKLVETVSVETVIACMDIGAKHEYELDEGVREFTTLQDLAILRQEAEK